MTSSLSLPFQPWPEPTVFSGIPDLPVVPLPQAEEDIASWLQAVAETYGMSLGAYLAHLGMPRVQDGSNLADELILNPPAQLLTRVQQNTGIHEARLAAMTFVGLDPDLASAALNHRVSCTACTAAAIARAGRPVSLLGARAVWRIVCPVHPPFPKPEEVSPEVDLAPVYARIRGILSILDRAAFDPWGLSAHMPALHPAVTAGTAVHFAYLLNSFLQVRLETYDALRDVAVFRVLRTYEPVHRGRPMPLPVEVRNDRSFSLLLAWQLLSLPAWALLVGLQLRAGPKYAAPDPVTRDRAVFDLLLDVWSGEVLSDLILGYERSETVRFPSPYRLTRAADRLTAHYGNHPDFEKIRRVASEQHSSFIHHLFSTEVTRRPVATYSAFEGGGPFRYRVLPADRRTAAMVAALRRNAWKQRRWTRHLQKLRARPPKRVAPKAPEPPLKLMSAAAIKAAVESAILEVGILESKIKPKDRRRHWQKLVRAGMNALERARRRDETSDPAVSSAAATAPTAKADATQGA